MLSYILTVVAIFAMMGLWLLVQNAWRKTFFGHNSEEDVLAIRGGCHGCDCIGHCLKDGSALNAQTSTSQENKKTG